MHWFDFSKDVEILPNSTVSGFNDLLSNAASFEIVGAPVYDPRARGSLGGVLLGKSGEESYLRFSATAGSTPEIFIVHRVLKNSTNTLLFADDSSAVSDYTFGTVGGDSIGITSVNGDVVASVHARLGQWHVANVYFGRGGEGFVHTIDSGAFKNFAADGEVAVGALQSVRLGCAAGVSTCSSSYIGEVLIFNQTLTHRGRRQVASYLLSKWGVGLAATTKTELTAHDASNGDAFGTAVAVSENIMVVGAPGDNDRGSNSGSAYVFAKSGSRWRKQCKLTASDGASGAKFGHAVAISGDTVAIGAPGGTYNAGGTVFVRNDLDVTNRRNSPRLTTETIVREYQ